MLKNEENKCFFNILMIIFDVVFSNQMIYFKQIGYDMIFFYQFEGYFNNKINLSGKVVVLIFDDGFKLVYCYVYLILKENGFWVIVFIILLCIKCYLQKWNFDLLQFMSIFELKEIQDVFDI